MKEMRCNFADCRVSYVDLSISKNVIECNTLDCRGIVRSGKVEVIKYKIE